MSATLAACLLAGVAAAALSGLLAPPAPRLRARVRPYVSSSHRAPGPRAPGRRAGPSGVAALRDGVERLRLRWAGAAERDEELALRLRQAGLLLDVPAPRRAAEYRARQGARALLHALGLAAAAVLTGQQPATVLVAACLGAAAGAARWRSKVDRAITERRDRLRVELYTVNQLLALHVRVGGGVAQALQRVVSRGEGVAVQELADVLRAHRSGRSLAAALDDAAQATPEPHAARTYRLLARGADFGADLAEGLRCLSEDLRQERREALVRAATRRRAAMLVPIIALLAPVMLLFVAAPLPSIVFSR